jgi:polysaccharide pyruvyl transferase CsaB
VPQRILIVGCVGFGNAGDEAIAQVASGHLREAIPEAAITILSGNPTQTAVDYGVRTIPWQDPVAIAEAVQNTDLILLGGGGLFQDYWGFDPTTVLTRGHWGLSFYTAPALLAAISGKPLMLYGVGVGPLFSDAGRQYTKAAAQIASRITVRDFVSKELLESLGIAPEKITVTADPAFDLQPAVEAPDLPEIAEWLDGRPAIAVCLRSWKLAANPDVCEAHIAAALDEILEREGAKALFLPFHLAPELADHDDAITANRVMAKLRQHQNAAVLSQPCSPQTLAGLIAKADLTVGMRLHSIIFSLMAGTPFVALEYDPKLAGLSALTGFEDFTLPYDGIEAPVLAGRMRQALEGRDDFRDRAREAATNLRCNARKNALIAAELVRSESTSDAELEARVLAGRMLIHHVAAHGRLEDALGEQRLEVERTRRLLEQAWVDSAHARAETERARGETERARGETERALTEAAQSQVAAEKSASAAAAAEALHQQEVFRAAQLMRDLEETRGSLEQAWRYGEGLAAQKQALELDLAWFSQSARTLEERVARLESKRPTDLAKRSFQIVLDTFEVLTPTRIRAAIRKYYLNWFYFRIYPEKRAHNVAPLERPSAQSGGGETDQHRAGISSVK